MIPDGEYGELRRRLPTPTPKRQVGERGEFPKIPQFPARNSPAKQRVIEYLDNNPNEKGSAREIGRKLEVDHKTVSAVLKSRVQ